ncbi:MAG TPA: hypothetical protein VMV20_06200 [Chitinophagaceae bacterium]|nr:hypothetical protein [Chitinophagaceae bacterium]
MIRFKSGEVPDLPFLLVVKKRIPVRAIRMEEPFLVETLEGVFEGNSGDYLMVGVRGEMYPCQREIFEETYEILGPGNSAGK